MPAWGGSDPCRGSPAVAAATPAVAAATATAATVAVATAAAAATTAAFTGGGFVDADHAAHPLDVLEVIDGLLFRSVIGEFHEGEAPLAAGFAIKGQAAVAHLSVLAEEIKEILTFGLEREVSDVDGH
jgi:hypothetical protein